jgi:hypothetical protein
MELTEKGPLYNYVLLEKDVIYGVLRPDAHPTIENQRDQVLELAVRCGGPFYAIGDITTVRQMSKPERDFSKSDVVKENMKAMAFIVKSPLARIIGNLYMGLTGSAVPTEVFTDFEAALAWIQRRKKEDQE